MAINLTTPGTRHVENALRRGAKTALVAGGIRPSSRRGNRELDLAVRRLAQQTYSSLQEATQAGKALGQKIVERSQAKGKTDLDGGIVRQLLLTGEIPTVVKVTAKPAKTAPVVVDAGLKAAEPLIAKPAVAATEEDVKDEIKGEVPKAEAIAAVAAEELDTPEADVVPADGPGIKALATVDPETAEAPDVDAIEALEPAAIDDPEPEPLTAADSAVVEASPDAIAAAPEAVGKAN